MDKGFDAPLGSRRGLLTLLVCVCVCVRMCMCVCVCVRAHNHAYGCERLRVITKPGVHQLGKNKTAPHLLLKEHRHSHTLSHHAAYTFLVDHIMHHTTLVQPL